MRGTRGFRRFVVAFGALGLAGGLAACGSSTGSASSSHSTTTTGTGSGKCATVALEGPLTGSQAPTGQDMLRGARLAASQLSSSGGVLGRCIHVLGVDDAADPATGVKAAEHAIAQHPVAVIGPYNSGVGVENLPLYRKAGIPILRLTSANSTQGYGVTTQPMADQVAPVEAKALTQVFHASSVAELYDPSAYTKGIATELASQLRADGVSVPVLEAVPPSTSASVQQASISAALAKVAKVHPSVTYLAMYGPEAGMAAKSMATTNLPAGESYGQCFTDLAAQGDEFISAAGSAASTCVSSGVPDASQLPNGATYVRQYVAAYHVEPATWGAFTYDSMKVLAAAAGRAGTWSASRLAARLADTRDYLGVTGSISFEAKTGNRVDPPIVILSITAGGAYQIDTAWSAAQSGSSTTTTAPSTTTTTKVPPSTTTTTSTSTTTTSTTTTSTTTTTTTVPPTTTTTTSP